MNDSNRRHYLLVVLVLALAAFLRFFNLENAPPGFHNDEAADANDGLQAWRTHSFQVFYPENGGREGLYMNLQGVALGLIGQNKPWVVRLPSALLGTLTVLGLYLLGTRLLKRETALFAAFLLSTCFWHLVISRYGTRPAAGPVFLVWSFYLAFVACEWRQKNSPRWWLIALLAGVVYGLGFHTYIAFRATPVILVALFIYLARRYETKNVVAPAAVLLTAGFFVALPLALYAWLHPNEFFLRMSQMPEFKMSSFWPNTWKTLAMFNFAGDENARQNIPGKALLFLPTGILLWIGFVRGFRQLWVLIVWLAIGALPAIIANEGVPHAFRSCLMIPAICLFAALGGEYVWDLLARVSPPRLTLAVTAVLCAVITFECWHSYFITWARNDNVGKWLMAPLADLARDMDETPDAIPKYVLIESSGWRVRGYPAEGQIFMFLTDTFTPERQAARNFHYLTAADKDRLPALRGYVVYFRKVLEPGATSIAPTLEVSKPAY